MKCKARRPPREDEHPKDTLIWATADDFGGIIFGHSDGFTSLNDAIDTPETVSLNNSD